MDEAQTIISKYKLATTSDYWRAYKEIQSLHLTSDSQKIKIALLSSSTINGLDKVLHVKCAGLGLQADVYNGAYGQYAQEIINEQGPLYAFDADLIIIFIDTRSLLGEAYLDPYSSGDATLQDLVRAKYQELTDLVGQLQQRVRAKIILHNFEVPIISSYGIGEAKLPDGLIESIRSLNADLAQRFKDEGQVTVFDYENFCSRYGKQNILNYKLYYLADIKLDVKYYPELSEEYLGYVIPLKAKTKKCLVLDLDNTLWGGIIGEDGLGGIKLGPTPDGRSFYEFQQYILALHKRGVVLAINSKNNEADAMEVLHKHPYMVLQEDNFASIQINWDDKATNLRRIAEELNIGLDSLVFVDDDEMNRELVRQSLPEVKVVDLPKDFSGYLSTLSELKDFNVFQVTSEDKDKGKMYVDQRKRTVLKSKFPDIDDFIKGLDMTVSIELMNQYSLPRIAQLTQKTNQFNLVTRRYQEEDLLAMQKRGDLIYVVSVKDKFGDNGMVGVIILQNNDQTMVIDTLLLSCRLIGRKVEKLMLYHIYDIAKLHNKKYIIGSYIPTPKNALVKDLFLDNGFAEIESVDGIERWQYDMINEYQLISIINFKTT